MRPVGLLLWLVATVVLVATGSVAAQSDDLSPQSEAWNGLREFVAIAASRGAPVEVVSRLDIGTLTPADALLLFSPDAAPPAAEITRFLRAGGRVVLADDFGRGDTLLANFRIERSAPRAEGAPRLRDNDALLVAAAAVSHPLTDGVAALVTNHPQVVRHDELEPLFALAPNEAVVLAGAVRDGRLVVVSDPSVLINNMLELDGNRRFAENLVDYLREGRAPTGGRVLLLPPRGVLVGRFGTPGADRPLHDLRARLDEFARLEVPPAALRIVATTVVGLVLLFGAGTLPRGSPYSSRAMFPRPRVAGGFAGRLEWALRQPPQLSEVLRVYGLELEAELQRHLALPGRPSVTELTNAMRAKGMNASEQNRAQALFTELGALRDARGPVDVGEARFRRLFAEGEALLASARRRA